MTRLSLFVAAVLLGVGVGFGLGVVYAHAVMQPHVDVEVSAGYDGQLLTGRAEIVSARLERASRAQAVHDGQIHAHRAFGARLTSEAVRQRDEHRQQVAAAEAARRVATTRSSPNRTGGFVGSGDVWARLAACESGGRWDLNTGNGFYGGLQFSLSSWQWVGGAGYPHEASPAEQIARAQELVRRQGFARAFPGCSAKLGLR